MLITILKMGSCLKKPKISDSPIVINKKKKRKRKQTIPKTLKKMVWDKYVGENNGKAKCYCCKHQDIRQIDFEAGHVVAESMGGKTNINNLRPICHQCNMSMGNMNMNEFMKKYNL